MTTVTLDLHGLADLLKVDSETARDLLVAGDIPGARIGRAWVILMEDALGYLRLQVQEQTATRRSKREIDDALPRPMLVTPPGQSRRKPLPKLPALPQLRAEPASSKINVAH